MISLPCHRARRHPKPEEDVSTETIEVTGHIVDSLLLAKILDTILDAGCDYEISDVRTSARPASTRAGPAST